MLINQRVFAAALRSVPNLAVLHVGAHQAEESAMYTDLGAEHAYWVEAQPDKCADMREHLDPAHNSVFEAVAWSVSGEKLTFHVSSNSQSSSVFEFKDHTMWHPEIVEVSSREVVTTRLEEVLPQRRYDFVVLDVQGAELEALQGMGRLLDDCSVICTEVNRSEAYKGIAQIGQLDAWLATRGFTRIVTVWATGTGYGDAIYVSGNVPWSDRVAARTLAAAMKAKREAWRIGRGVSDRLRRSD